MSEPAMALMHGGRPRAPYTVDDLFEMPDDGNRYEVLGGSLIVSPAPSPKHQYVSDELRLLVHRAVPSGVYVVSAVAVRLPGGDGPVPDIVIATANPITAPAALPVENVHTVVEVVSPGNALNDRAYKRELYAEAGIGCYWRVETEPWRGHDGPTPLIVVRLRGADGWHAIEAAAGTPSTLPLSIGTDADGLPVTIDVRIDPAQLVA